MHQFFGWSEIDGWGVISGCYNYIISCLAMIFLCATVVSLAAKTKGWPGEVRNDFHWPATIAGGEPNWLQFTRLQCNTLFNLAYHIIPARGPTKKGPLAGTLGQKTKPLGINGIKIQLGCFPDAPHTQCHMYTNK